MIADPAPSRTATLGDITTQTVMVNSDLIQLDRSERKPRVCAVSYLNTIPLVWGAMHGPQQGKIDLTFAIPSVCADRVAEGTADVGILPVIEVERLGLTTVPGIGIAFREAVRTILLISKVPYEKIATLAVDSGSRTSVQLARIILQRGYGATPTLFRHEPDLVKMLAYADAALVIGDAALRIDPPALEHRCLDLGKEWVSMTGLPFATAMWAGPKEAVTPELTKLLHGSYQCGLQNLDAIIRGEAERRGFPEWLVRQYLTRNIVFQLGGAEMEGIRTYLQYVKELDKPILMETLAHDDARASR